MKVYITMKFPDGISDGIQRAAELSVAQLDGLSDEEREELVDGRMRSEGKESTTMCETGCGRGAKYQLETTPEIGLGLAEWCEVCNLLPDTEFRRAIEKYRRRSRPAADQSLGVTCCVLCGGRGGLTTWGNMDSSELGGVKVCDVCVPEMRVEDRGETNVRNANRMRARLGKEPWSCDKCGEKPAVCMPGWSALCADCDRAELRDTPAPQDDSGFKVGDRVIHKANEGGRGPGTVTQVALGMVNVRHDSGPHLAYGPVALTCWVDAPSKDPKRQPEANPLRHLAEAFRELSESFTCGVCEREVLGYRMGDWSRCVYCLHQRRLAMTKDAEGRYVENPLRDISSRLDARIASATPKEAERREVWDWPVDSSNPIGGMP